MSDVKKVHKTGQGGKATKKSSNHHHRKSRTGKKRRSRKKEKRGGFLSCCAKKKKRTERKSKKHGSKSKGHKKPKAKVPPPKLPIDPTKAPPTLAALQQTGPLENEELGGIVLVRDAKDPKKLEESKMGYAPTAAVVVQTSGKSAEGIQKKTTLEGEDLQTARLGEEIKTEEDNGQENNKRKDSSKKGKVGGSDEKVKKDSTKEEDEDNEKKKKEKGKDSDRGMEGKENEVEEGRQEVEDEKTDRTNSKKEKWQKIVNNSKGNITIEYNMVAGYMPNNVTRQHWLDNTHNNRFADVVCMDHSRVALANGQYIHANWIEIDEKTKAIATQFPLSETAADFWQMVIENNVKVILMIVSPDEYEDFGGSSVFPPQQDFIQIRDMRIGEFRRVTVRKDWTLRVLTVSDGNTKTYVHVHHYASWPHGNVPRTPKELWQVQSVMRKYKGPAVYMSLSGCGRAGTYAVFEAAHASLHSNKPIFSVAQSVIQVRNCRMHSLQTAAQFTLVHDLLMDHACKNGFKRDSSRDSDGVSKTIDQLIFKD